MELFQFLRWMPSAYLTRYYSLFEWFIILLFRYWYFLDFKIKSLLYFSWLLEVLKMDTKTMNLRWVISLCAYFSVSITTKYTCNSNKIEDHDECNDDDNDCKDHDQHGHNFRNNFYHILGTCCWLFFRWPLKLLLWTRQNLVLLCVKLFLFNSFYKHIQSHLL